MFKPPTLCRFAICRRLAMIVIMWAVCLVGANEIRMAAQGDSTVYDGIKRLAVYSLALQANQ